MKAHKSEQHAMQEAVKEALKFLTPDKRKEVLSFIRLLRKEWNGELPEGIKLLTVGEAGRVLEYIALMPPEGNPKNGGPNKA
jgi:hypothetical protein